MNLVHAIKAEVIKTRSSSTLRSTFIAFAIAPVMGAVFVTLSRDPDSLAKASAIQLKMKMLGFTPDWGSYFSLLMQAVGVGGVLIFGFVASWIFGREYSEGTAKDLLSLPTSRTTILNAKFILFLVWAILLSISNVIIGLLLSLILSIPVPDSFDVLQAARDYFSVTFLTAILGTVIAFFALWGKGYLAPLGFVGLTLVFAQVIAAVGYGNYFPWSVPGLLSGSGGEYKDKLNVISYCILFATAAFGYVSTIIYWKNTDHTK